MTAGEWMPVMENDPRLHALRQRHYSVKNKAPKMLRCGPGEKTCLLVMSAFGNEALAALVWQYQRLRHLRDKTYCAIFRNEGAGLSSDLLLAAEAFIPAHYPRAMLTYVEGAAVGGDGKCFKIAGWHKTGRTKTRGKIILEKTLQ